MFSSGCRHGNSYNISANKPKSSDIPPAPSNPRVGQVIPASGKPGTWVGPGVGVAPTGVAVGVGVGDPVGVGVGEPLGVGVGVGVGDPLGVGVGVGVGEAVTLNANVHTGPSARDGTLAVGALVFCNCRAVSIATIASPTVSTNKPKNKIFFTFIALAPRWYNWF